VWPVFTPVSVGKIKPISGVVASEYRDRGNRASQAIINFRW
jgi:hypothetical protein